MMDKFKVILTVMVVLGVLLSGVSFAKEKTVNLDLVNADLVDVIKLFAREAKCDVVIDSAVKGTVNMSFKNVQFETALGIVVKISGFDYRKVGDLIIVSTADKVSEIAAKISIPTGPTATQIIPLEYANPKQMILAIKSNFPGIDASEEEKLNAVMVKASPGAIKKVKSLVSKLDIPKPEIDVPEVRTQIVELKYTDTKKITEQITSVMPGLDYKVDERLNALVVKGTDVTFAKLDKFLKQVDIPLDQVSLEVKVLVLYKTGQKNLGVNFSVTNPISSFSTTLTEAQWSAAGYTAAPTYMDIRLGGLFPFIRTPISMTYALDTLISRGYGEVVANPNITTYSGKEAKIESTRVFRYVYYDSRSGVYSINEANVGISLTVTPTVTEDGYIVAKIKPTLTGFRALVSNLYPWTDKREAEMTVRVKDGEPIVIGGLLKETKSKTVSKIPILGDIPIVGNLFKGTAVTKRVDEVVIVVTPKIISRI